MYKVYNYILLHYVMEIFTPNSTTRGHNTRQCDDFHVPYHWLFLTSNSIRVYGVNVWNSIWEDIRNVQSFKSFRTKYKFGNINNIYAIT